MIAGIDTDFLVALTLSGHPDRAGAVHTRDRLLKTGSTFILTGQVVAEFLHVVTDPRRFSEPLAMEGAVNKAEEWIQAREVQVLAPDHGAMLQFIGMMRQGRFGRKRILDTLLGASLLSAGISTLVTGNFIHYREFQGLELIDFRQTI